MPTKIFDVTTFGANGSHAGDDTLGIQAAIDAAAKAGHGAMVRQRRCGLTRLNRRLDIFSSYENTWDLTGANTHRLKYNFIPSLRRCGF